MPYFPQGRAMALSLPGRWRSSTTSWGRCARRSWAAMTLELEAPRILVVDADPALFGLLQEWLAAEGCQLVEDDPDLVLVDIVFPRQGRCAALEWIKREHRGIPVLALSSSFFARVEGNGDVAQALGVA